MKTKEIREKATEELVSEAQDLAEELFKLKFQHGIRPLENTARLQALKKDIARIRTVLSERRIEEKQEASA